MRMLVLVLLLVSLVAPAWAKGDPTGEKVSRDRSDHDCGKHGQAFGAPDQGEMDWAWYAVDQFGRRLSLAYEFNKACEPQLRLLAAQGAVKCAWVRR